MEEGVASIGQNKVLVGAQKRPAVDQNGNPNAPKRHCLEEQRSIETSCDVLVECRTFTCPFCLDPFTDFRLLQAHLIEKERLLDLYACHVCLNAFHSLSVLRSHVCETPVEAGSSDDDASSSLSDKNNSLRFCYHLLACYGCGAQVPLHDPTYAVDLFHSLVGQYGSATPPHPVDKLVNIAVYTTQRFAADTLVEKQHTLRVAYTPHVRGIPLKCSVCSVAFADADDVEQHTACAHVPQRITCPQCCKSFASELFFREHLLSCHLNDFGHVAGLLELCHNSSGSDNGHRRRKRLKARCPKCELWTTTGKCCLQFASPRVMLSEEKFVEVAKKTFQAIGRLFLTQNNELCESLDRGRAKGSILGCKLCFVLFHNTMSLQQHIQMIHREEIGIGVRFDTLVVNLTRDLDGYLAVACPSVDCPALHCSVLGLRRHLLTEHMKWVPAPKSQTVSRPSSANSDVNRVSRAPSRSGCTSAAEDRLVGRASSALSVPSRPPSAAGSRSSNPPELDRQEEEEDERPPSCSTLHPLPGGLVPEIDCLVPDATQTVTISNSTPVVVKAKPSVSSSAGKGLTPLVTPSVSDYVVSSLRPTASSAAVQGTWLCPICRRAFEQVLALRVHIHAIHMHICHKCAACFVSGSMCRGHQSTCSTSWEAVRPDATFFCYICGVTDFTLVQYYRHLVDAHSSKVNFDQKTGQVFPMCGAIVKASPSHAGSQLKTSSGNNHAAPVTLLTASTSTTSTIVAAKGFKCPTCPAVLLELAALQAHVCPLNCQQGSQQMRNRRWYRIPFSANAPPVVVSASREPQRSVITARSIASTAQSTTIERHSPLLRASNSISPPVLFQECQDRPTSGDGIGKDKTVVIDVPNLNETEDDDEVIVLETSGATQSSSGSERSMAQSEMRSCDACSATFRTQKALSEHSLTHRLDAGNTVDVVLPVPVDIGVYICRLCSLAYGDADVFKKHWSRHHMIYGCLECTAVCFSADQLSQHRRMHHAIVYGCSFCLKAFASELYLHWHLFNSHQQPLLWLCKLCGYGHTRRPAMRAHFTAMHQVKASVDPFRSKSIGVCVLKKLHYQPAASEITDELRSTTPPAECSHRSFLMYNEPVIACDQCGTLVPATKLVLENKRLHDMENVTLMRLTRDQDSEGEPLWPDDPQTLPRVTPIRTHLKIAPKPSSYGGPPTLTPMTTPAAAIPSQQIQMPSIESAHAATSRGCVCNVCKATLSTVAAYKVHLLKHSTASNFCLECGQPFMSLTEYHVHVLRVHKNKLVYQLSCPVRGCTYVGYEPFEFHKHLKEDEKNIATTDKKHGSYLPFVSGSDALLGCALRFASERACERHAAAHAVDGGYCCPLCGACFASVGATVVHLAQHSRVDYSMCRQCGLCFQNDSRAVDHFKACHIKADALQWRCTICDHLLPSISIPMHMTSIHKVTGHKLRKFTELNTSEFREFLGLL